MTQLDSLPQHVRTPDLRPIQPVPIQRDGKRLVALRDPAMLAQHTMIVPPQVLMVLQHFRGELAIEEIAERLNGEVDQFVELARGLDQVGLLWGPTFDRLEADRKAAIDRQGAIPAAAALTMGEDAEVCRSRMDEYFAQTEDPELDGPVLGIVAPHLDYDRGWPNYGAAYYMLRDAPKPDRAVILGTNHFGIGDGAVVAQYGFESPMGRCPIDEEVMRGLLGELGEPLVIDQLDHLGEHSVQLQLPWLQYCFGDIPVVAALLPDPLVPMIEEDGRRVDGEQFTTVLQAVLERIGGRTLLVSSSDLSHVGPQFGEPRPVNEQRRIDVEQHDREMLTQFISGNAETFVSALRWNKNPTRWCSVGSMTALLRLAGSETVELIDYRQAYDDQGTALVSSAALVIQ
jgi:AmmeMemoRadiSam system protein B